jgi:hypothetical protein
MDVMLLTPLTIGIAPASPPHETASLTRGDVVSGDASVDGSCIISQLQDHHRSELPARPPMGAQHCFTDAMIYTDCGPMVLVAGQNVGPVDDVDS